MLYYCFATEEHLLLGKETIIMVKRVILVVAGLGVGLVLFQFLSSGSPNDVESKSEFEVVAHRGVHVNWKKGTYDRATGCEAIHIYKPTHDYIENTIESIAAAFEMGATIVEIDIRRTSDDHLVIFHDYMLECRTNGEGKISDYPLEYLQQLDIGYGYTPDDGQTYPFRGKGVGKMPTLVEVLEKFPNKKFLIDHKDGSLETAQLLIEIIKPLPVEQQELLYHWGPPEITEYIQQEIPTIIRLFGNRPQVKACLMPYLLTAGLRGFPETCEGLGVGMPTQYVKFVVGWPYKFLNKLSEANAKFYLMVDTEEEAQAFLDMPVDGIVTDYIEVLGKYYD
jgi:glycerophosphoryl diester phosphodiesterase